LESKSIALDGPSGAGKSTLAKMSAKRFGLVYVDTGAMYRAVGCYALGKNIPTDDWERVTELLPEIELEIKFISGEQRIYCNGEDYSETIRRPEASMAASNVSAIPAVRAFLLDLQRDFGRRHSIVMDGRDIGTVIFPDAGIKIFLTATSDDRARRRYEEQIAKDFDVDYNTVLADIIRRDENDSSRATAPLKPADDAIILDTTGNDVEKSFKEIYSICMDNCK